MVKINRKNFILLLASSAAGIFLTSCLSRMGISTTSVSIFSTAASTAAGTTSPASTESSSTIAGSETESTKTPAETTSQKSLVGIAGSTGSLSAQVEKAVALAGGLGFIRKGSTVLIKPNFNTGDPHPASTNPEVIRHVIRLVKNQDPYAILIGDRSSFWTGTLKCMKKNGVYEVAEQEGAELHLARTADFIVMDGTKVFVEGGPTEGKVVEAGLVVASNDIIANDTVGLAILKTLGTTTKIQDNSVWSQPQIARAVELELGAGSIADIRISSENVRGIDKILSNLA